MYHLRSMFQISCPFSQLLTCLELGGREILILIERYCWVIWTAYMLLCNKVINPLSLKYFMKFVSRWTTGSFSRSMIILNYRNVYIRGSERLPTMVYDNQNYWVF
jgi:hypothetical protein